MNSLVHASVLGFSLIASTLASAKTFSGVLNALDSTKYENATATVNYKAKTLTLSLQPRMPVCPEGRMCIQAFPPAITLIFKGAKSFKDSCGVIITQVRTAKAPIDGSKTEITLVNNSENSCESSPELIASLALKNREGAPVDSFVSARELSAELKGAAVGQYLDGRLVLNRGTGDVNVSLQPLMPVCPEGMVCAQVMPLPVELFFTKAVTTTNDCGVVQTQTGLVWNENEARFFTVLINDNRKNTCPTLVALAPLDIVVRSSETAEFSDEAAVEVDQLTSEGLN
ncbi:MAG TPA: hypothetical protein VFO10_17710 [Oligoflexus sp.]|uniref:hypothetical protein n=1 Tax=Oligoflexus sp. TaxID=1971216 RepID=UPI002D7F5684|nr:hypothetical protein [Oligoflexus sp.]HET9239100.1 hypothetical protein [Oligoflexus sp.]